MPLRNIDVRAGLVLDEVEEIISSRTAKYEDPQDIGLQLRQVLSNVILSRKGYGAQGYGAEDPARADAQ